MQLPFISLLLLAAAVAVCSFAPNPTVSKSSLVTLKSKTEFKRLSLCCCVSTVSVPSHLTPYSRLLCRRVVGYVPDGFTPAQWKKKQEEERKKKQGKNYAATGPQSFKSRSLQAFQTELEKGKAEHLLPVMFAKDRVKKGEIKPEDVPYMQRGGSWDNADVKGAKKRAWSKVDEKYSDKPQGSRIDWTGSSPRRGPQSKKTNDDEKPVTRKLFGLF